METPRFAGSRQGFLFPPSRAAMPVLDPNHRYVQLTERLDWDELIAIAQQVRRRKLKNGAGKKPHLRTMLGAVILIGLRRVTYRDAEDLIRHYTPARYLCGLTETDWTPDFTTIQDFTELMGEDGIRAINEYAVHEAVRENLADPKVLVADTTAQEAPIPYPNEVGLMTTFLAVVAAASKKAGGVLATFCKQMASTFSRGKTLLRNHRLFAKTKEARLKITGQLASLVGKVQRKLGKALTRGDKAKAKAQNHKKVAWRKLGDIHKTMVTLLPQIQSWIKTGFVAKNKIVSIHMPEVRAIPRGKVGKTVEFGLKWGIRHLKGGFVLGTVAPERGNFSDHTDAIEAVDEHIELFGFPPRRYGYDRGGYSPKAITLLRQRGVQHIGVAPTGKDAWQVSNRVKVEIVRERSRIEGDIGSIKHDRYGFNRPAAKSVAMMGACGQRAMLGYNLNKLVRRLAAREELVLVG